MSLEKRSNNLLKQLFSLHSQMIVFSPGKSLPRGEFIVLFHIKKIQESLKTEDGVKMSLVRNIVRASKPAFSKTLGNLESKGFVTRLVDELDRRGFLITLTPLGESYLSECEVEINKLFNSILDEMGDEDTDELISLLSQLNSILEKKKENKSISNDEMP